MDTNKYLSIVLLESVSFEELVLKISRAFEISLSCEDEKGRYIAKGFTNDFEIELIDKIDRLGDFISDENYTLDFIIPLNNCLNYKKIEESIKNQLKYSNIAWKYGIWSKSSFDDNAHKILPNDV